MAYALKYQELLAPVRQLRHIKADNLVLGGLGVIALVFGYLSFSPPTLSVQEAKGEKIAEISAIESTVKRKSADGLAWDAASESEVLYGGDQIFTDSASNAKVRFKDGSEIAVAENSLIKIEQTNGKTTIDMSKGFVSGKFGDDQSNFAIKLGGTNVKLDKGAEIQVKVDPNNKGATKIALISGNAAVDSGTGKGAVTLKKDQLLSVDAAGKAKIEEIDLRLLSPAQGAKIDDSSGEVLRFSWSSSLTNGTYTLKIANDPLFKNIYLSKSVSTKAVTVPIPPAGSWYWKVESRSGSGKTDQSVELQFTVNKLAAPELLAPVGGRKFQYEGSGPDAGDKSPLISLIWKAVPGASAYEIEVARSKNFSPKTLTKQLTTTSLDTRELSGGIWYWRVRAKSETSEKFGAFSQPADFELVKLDVPAAPKLLDPPQEGRAKPDQPVAFRWEEVPAADGYEIQISQSKSFDSDTVIAKVQAPQHSWNPPAAGGYYWRVRPLDKFNRETKFSPFRRLVIDGAVPQLVIPEASAEIIMTEKNMKVEFQWLETSGAQGYQIEISSEQNFSKPKVRKSVPGNSFKAENLTAGVWFWRVRAMMPGGAETAWSNVRGLSLKELQLLQPPVLKERYYFRIAPPVPGTALLRQIFNILTLTETAYAQEDDVGNVSVDSAEPSNVAISWKPVDGAAAYYVELAQDKSFEDILIKRRSTTPNFSWPGARAGRYWFRAASVDQLERKGNFSRLAELIVSYKAPYLVEPKDNQTLTRSAAEPDVDFTWQFVKGASYTLEVSQKQDFSRLILTKKVTTNKLTTSALRAGKIYWRVKAQYAKGLPVETSRTGTFVLTREKIKAPVLMAPENGSRVLSPAQTASVIFKTDASDSAEITELELSRSESFTTVEKRLNISGSGENEMKAVLPSGTWFTRARSGAGKKADGDYSQTVSFTIKQMLPAPKMIQPKKSQTMTILGDSPRAIPFSWKAVAKAEQYELELSPDDDFEDDVQTSKISDTKAKPELKAGTWYARVRATDKDGDPGRWSATHELTIKNSNIDAPELKFPGDGELLGRRKSLKLEWEKEVGYDGYKVVLAKDKDFSDVVSEQVVSKDNSTVKIPESGQYYWYVEGENKKNQYAMRSDVQSFTISDYAATGKDKLRIIAGFAPSVISNTMVSDNAINSMSVTVFNSFMINGQYWLTNSFGIETAYHRKSTELYDDAGGEQGTLTYAPQNFDLNLKYRLPLGKGVTTPELQARAGYMYKAFYTFFARNRTSLSLRESSTSNAGLGLGAKYPFSLSKYLEAWADYAATVGSAPVQVSSGSHLMFDGRYYMMFASRVNAGVGYRYASGLYKFTDPDNAVTGSLEETTHSIIGALGYGF